MAAPGVLLIVMAFGSVLLISPDLAQRMSGVVSACRDRTTARLQ